MRVHLVQLDCVWEDKAANMAGVERLLGTLQPSILSRGDLVILPEMFDTGFSCNLSVTADTTGQTLGFVKSVARQRSVFVHGARTIVGPDGLGRNQAVIANPAGEIVCVFEKIHLFPLGVDKESERFASGQGVMTYAWTSEPGAALCVCPAICYDLRFPEQFRVGLEMGAEAFAVTSSWPATRESHRRTLSIARAIENQAFVFSINRCGRDPNLEYAGGSLVVSPRGDVLAELGPEEAVLSVEIDPADLRRWRGVFPAWKDQRPIARAQQS